MSRDWRLFLDDMVEAAEKAARYTAGRDFESFVADEAVVDAVLMNVLVIGEAAKSLPSEGIEKARDMDWSGAAGLRDIIAHRYFGVDRPLVWDIAQPRRERAAPSPSSPMARRARMPGSGTAGASSTPRSSTTRSL